VIYYFEIDKDEIKNFVYARKFSEKFCITFSINLLKRSILIQYI